MCLFSFLGWLASSQSLVANTSATPATPLPSYESSAYTFTIRRGLRTPGGVVVRNFNCQLDIRITVLENTDTITLHHSNEKLSFNFLEVVLFDQHGNLSVQPESNELNQFPRTIEMKFTTHLNQGETYWLKMSYVLEVSNNPTWGLSVADQPAETGKAALIGTVLWPSFATHLMPCLISKDPSARATFQLILETEDDETAVTNTNLKRTEPCLPVSDEPSGCVLHTFEKTPPMTPSQFGFVVSQFGSHVVPVGSRGKFLGLYVSRRQLLDQSRRQRALCFAMKLYEACANLTGKEPEWNIKMVAVRDLPYDSVDALGLILFRESALVFINESPSAAESHVRWILAMAQNMARMWFGHVNTNVEDTEKNVWTKESFATYFQYELAYQLTGDSLYRDLIYTRSIMPALHADSLEGSHVLEIEYPSDTDGYFLYRDVITTGKGSAFIQTVRHVFTDVIFQQMLRTYFESRSLKEALLQSAAATLHGFWPICNGKPLCFITSWVGNSGYPVIQVNRDSKLEKLIFNQKRFLLSSSSKEPEDSCWWQVPLLYSYGPSPEPPRVLYWSDLTGELSIPTNESNSWLLVNHRRTGFYRVNYEAQNWNLLARQTLTHPDALDPVSRAMLIDDALALARVGQLDYKTALRVVNSLRVEEDLIPWEAAREGLGFLQRGFKQSGSGNNTITAWMKELLTHVLEVVQFSPTGSDRQKLLRGVVMEMACDLDMPACTVPALEDYNKWLQDPNSVPHDTLAAVVCAGVREDVVGSVPKVTAALLDENDDVTRRAIIRGLGCVTDFDSVAHELMKNFKKLRKGETLLFYQSVSRTWGSPQKDVLQYLASSYSTIFESSPSEIFSIFNTLCDRFTEQEIFYKLSQLSDELGRLRTGQTTKVSLQLVKDNIEWFKTYGNAIIKALAGL